MSQWTPVVVLLLLLLLLPLFSASTRHNEEPYSSDILNSENNSNRKVENRKLAFPPMSEDEMVKILVELYNSTSGTEWNHQNGWREAFLARNGSINSTEISSIYVPPIDSWFGIDSYNNESQIISVALASNNLKGTLPSSLFRLSLDTLILRANAISGSIPDSICHCITLSTLHLQNNNLTGTIPECIGSFDSSLSTLQLADNGLFGTIPASFYNLTDLQIGIFSSNNLQGEISESISQLSVLRVLDLSNNMLSGSIPEGVGQARNLHHLVLSSNNLSGTLSRSILGKMATSMKKFVISENLIEGDLVNLALLKVATVVAVDSNRLSGNLPPIRLMPSLTYLDISNNLASGFLPVSDLFTGFTASGLAYFAATGNPGLKRDLSTEHLFPFFFLGSTVTKTSAANWTCATITMGGLLFPVKLDPSFLNYEHCTCIQGYYGVPPHNCFECPKVIASSPYSNIDCPGGKSIHWSSGTFPYFISQDQPSVPPIDFEACASPTGCNHHCYAVMENGANKSMIWATEDSSSSLEHRTPTDPKACPCNPGRVGRRCSQCVCNIDGTGSCYYSRYEDCILCQHVWSGRSSIALLLIVLFSLIVILILVHVLILKNRRSDEQDSKETSRLKAFFKRLVYLPKVGHFKILLIWTQTFSAISVWPSGIFKEVAVFLKLANGNPVGFGIVCIWPVLSVSLYYYLMIVFLPFIVGILIGVAITASNAVWHLFFDITPFPRSTSLPNLEMNSSPCDYERLETKQFIGVSGLADGSSVEDTVARDELVSGEQTEDQPFLSPSAHNAVNKGYFYSAYSLLISELLNVLYFFYFNVTLSSLNFFTAEIQHGTGIHYVQEYPWLPYHSQEAITLRKVTIPFLAIVTAGTPIVFCSLLFKFHKNIHSRLSYDTIGGLFEIYNDQSWLWEMVILLRRLVLALVLRIPASSAFFTWSIVMTFVVSILIQLHARPYKRLAENILEAVGLSLLLLTFSTQSSHESITIILSTSSNAVSHVIPVFWLTLAANCVYFLVSLAFLIKAWVFDDIVLPKYMQRECKA